MEIPCKTRDNMYFVETILYIVLVGDNTKLVRSTIMFKINYISKENFIDLLFQRLLQS